MISRHHRLMMVVVVCVIGCAGLLYARKKNAPPPAKTCAEARNCCNNSEKCRLNKNCQCYCSGIGGFRNKTENDKPVFVENDPNEVYCYCKQWDLDAYPRGERPADQPQ